MKKPLLLALALLVGCKQRPAPTSDTTPSALPSVAVSAVPIDTDAFDLEPRVMSSICAKLTDAPRVAERCGPLPSDAGAADVLSYSFKATKGAEDQASGLLAQIRTTKVFERVVASAAEKGQRHCENEAHHITIEFVGTPSELAELQACERLKSIP
jgi:hypothetical protein